MLGSLTASADVTGTTVQTKTVLRLQAPANNDRVEVYEWSISFGGIVATDHKPLVEVLMNSVGNGTSTVRTPQRVDPGTAALQSTGRENFTVEPATPAAKTIIKERVHPQAGYTWRGSLPLEPGGTLDIRVTGAGENWTCMPRMLFKESA